MHGVFKFIGALGLFLVSAGIITKQRQRQDLLYIMGGVLLEIYSIYLHDIIFIVLQIIFTLAGIYDFVKLKRGQVKL